MKKPTAALAVAIALAVFPVSASASLNARFGTDAAGMVTVPAISALASRVAGMPVTVRCYPTDDSSLQLGYTLQTASVDGSMTIAPVVYLNGRFCGSLWTAMHGWRHSWWTNSQDIGFALFALVHESMHIRLQSADEALVECTAYRNAWPALKFLGLPAWFRSDVYKSVILAHQNSPESYHAVC